MIAPRETNRECLAHGVPVAWSLQAGTREEQIANPRMETSKLLVAWFLPPGTAEEQIASPRIEKATLLVKNIHRAFWKITKFKPNKIGTFSHSTASRQ